MPCATGEEKNPIRFEACWSWEGILFLACRRAVQGGGVALRLKHVPVNWESVIPGCDAGLSLPQFLTLQYWIISVYLPVGA